jgi:plasmid stabilization system protein ParE
VTYQVEIAPTVRNQLADAVIYYTEAASRQVALRFVAQFEDTVLGLATFPSRYREVESVGARRVYFRSFPYVLWYRVGGSTVRVLALTHDRMNPGRVLRLVENGD